MHAHYACTACTACTNAQVLLIVAGGLPLLLNPCTASRPTDVANTSNATQAYVFIACADCWMQRALSELIYTPVIP